MRRGLAVAAVLVALLVGAGLAEAAESSRALSIVRGRASPHAVRVPAGTIVTWRNTDAAVREVVVARFRDRDGRTHELGVRSGPLTAYARGAPAASFSHAFAEPGSYDVLVGTTRSSVVVDAPRGPAVRPPAARTPTPTRTPRPPAVRTPTRTPTPRPPAPSALVQCRDWYAWRDLMPEVFPPGVPPAPPTLHLVGTCDLPDPGYSVRLTPRVLRGDVLLVDKTVVRLPGPWPAVNTSIPVRVELRTATAYREVVVMPDLVRVPVSEAH